MKKFSRIIEINLKKLKFYWSGRRLTGTEVAGRMEGAEILVVGDTIHGTGSGGQQDVGTGGGD